MTLLAGPKPFSVCVGGGGATYGWADFNPSSIYVKKGPAGTDISFSLLKQRLANLSVKIGLFSLVFDGIGFNIQHFLNLFTYLFLVFVEIRKPFKTFIKQLRLFLRRLASRNCLCCSYMHYF